jgi:hypothetical protein
MICGIKYSVPQLIVRIVFRAVKYNQIFFFPRVIIDTTRETIILSHALSIQHELVSAQSVTLPVAASYACSYRIKFRMTVHKITGKNCEIVTFL